MSSSAMQSDIILPGGGLAREIRHQVHAVARALHLRWREGRRAVVRIARGVRHHGAAGAEDPGACDPARGDAVRRCAGHVARPHARSTPTGASTASSRKATPRRRSNVSISMSQPLSGTSWEEIAEKGAIHVKSTGSYGPITAICSDLRGRQRARTAEVVRRGQGALADAHGPAAVLPRPPVVHRRRRSTACAQGEPEQRRRLPDRSHGRPHAAQHPRDLPREQDAAQPATRRARPLHERARRARPRHPRPRPRARVQRRRQLHRAREAVARGAAGPGHHLPRLGAVPVRRLEQQPEHCRRGVQAAALLGGYGHLGYRPILGQPSHTPRAQKVQIEKVATNHNGGTP